MTEKCKDYRNVVRVQLGLLLVVLLARDVIPWAGLSLALYLSLTVGYCYLLWDLLRHITRKAWLVRAVQFWFIFLFIAGLTVNEVLHNGSIHIGFNVFLHSGALAVELLVLRLALIDLFTGSRTSAEKIWASTAIYFMLGLAFTSLYRILHLIYPMALGVAVPIDYRGVYEVLDFSFSSLVGLDNPYPQAIHLFRNLRLLEGLLGQLYMVLLISRVLLNEEEPVTDRSSP